MNLSVGFAVACPSTGGYDPVREAKGQITKKELLGVPSLREMTGKA